MKGISAYNVNTGGGKTLLLSLLQELRNDENVICWLDERIKPFIPSMRGKVRFVVPTIFNRLKAEYEISKYSLHLKSLIFFGNLPPLFRPDPSAKCFLFLQNRYIIEKSSYNRVNFKSFARSIIERIWFKLFFSKSMTYVVQNDSMKRLFIEQMGKGNVCQVIPFADLENPSIEANHTEKKRSFIYIASPDTHKNHSTLLNAFSLLADEKIFPSLTLVFNQERYPDLLESVQLLNKKMGTDIQVWNEVTHEKIPGILKQHDCLIYPSKMESFGLPLIEAKAVGLDVIASELDYVRDLLDPNQVFDPNSAKSICRAVKRYLSLQEQRDSIRTPIEFLQELDF